MKNHAVILMSLLAGIAVLACSDSTAPLSGNEPTESLITALPPNAIPVNACETIIAAAGDYYLTSDLLNCGRPGAPQGILITGNNVTLHLNGHRMSTRVPDGPSFTCISVQGSDVTIRGPGILGWCSWGIGLADRTRVRGVRLNSFDLGIILGGVNSIVEDVTFGGHGYAAIWGQGQGTLMRHNTIDGPLEHAVLINGSGLQLDSNTFRNQKAAISVGGDHVTIIGNHIEYSMSGIIASGTGYTISGNKIFWTDISVEMSGAGNLITGNTIRYPNHGINITSGSMNNTVSNNRISAANTGGIAVFGPANLITGNVLWNNAWDMADSTANACQVNTWIGNTFTTAYPSCLH